MKNTVKSRFAVPREALGVHAAAPKKDPGNSRWFLEGVYLERVDHQTARAVGCDGYVVAAVDFKPPAFSDRPDAAEAFIPLDRAVAAFKAKVDKRAPEYPALIVRTGEKTNIVDHVGYESRSTEYATPDVKYPKYYNVVPVRVGKENFVLGTKQLQKLLDAAKNCGVEQLAFRASPGVARVDGITAQGRRFWGAIAQQKLRTLNSREPRKADRIRAEARWRNRSAAALGWTDGEETSFGEASSDGKQKTERTPIKADRADALLDHTISCRKCRRRGTKPRDRKVRRILEEVSKRCRIGTILVEQHREQQEELSKTARYKIEVEDHGGSTTIVAVDRDGSREVVGRL